MKGIRRSNLWLTQITIELNKYIFTPYLVSTIYNYTWGIYYWVLSFIMTV